MAYMLDACGYVQGHWPCQTQLYSLTGRPLPIVSYSGENDALRRYFPAICPREKKTRQWVLSTVSRQTCVSECRVGGYATIRQHRSGGMSVYVCVVSIINR